MVDVAYGAHVAVRLGTIKFFLRHFYSFRGSSPGFFIHLEGRD